MTQSQLSRPAHHFLATAAVLRAGRQSPCQPPLPLASGEREIVRPKRSIAQGQRARKVAREFCRRWHTATAIPPGLTDTDFDSLFKNWQDLSQFEQPRDPYYSLEHGSDRDESYIQSRGGGPPMIVS